MMFDLLLLVVVLLLGYRLFSALGKNPTVIEAEKHGKDVKKPPILTQEAEIKSYLPAFSEPIFMQGATKAFEHIVRGFTSGNLSSLDDLIDPAIMEHYKKVIQNRASKNIHCKLLFFRHISTKITSIRKETSKLFITLRFRSEQTLVLFDKNDTILEGNPDLSECLDDTWVFSCELPSSKPQWRLHKICM